MADTLARMRQIVGTSAQWAVNDLVLGDGEFALERRNDGACWLKIGNGIARFSTLPYVAGPTSADASSLALLLAGPTGLAQIGYKAAGPDAVQRTAEAKARDVYGGADYGIVADGTINGVGTDNLGNVNKVLAARHSAINLPEGRVLVSAAPTNLYGPRIGPGALLRTLNVKKDTQQLNVEVDDYRPIFGEEYLYQAHTKLATRAAFTLTFSGDSTTVGTSVTPVTFLLDKLVQQLVREAGFDVTVVNKGVAGINSEQWRGNYLAGDLATNPDVMVIRYGINDPSFYKSNANNAGAADTYTAEAALRRDASDYAATMRGALTTIRASRTVASLGIILMMPNATSDSPNGRDEKWYESIRGVLKRAARDFQCAFIDTYSLWAGARGAAGLWMDNPYADGRTVHPLAVMNGWIATQITNLLVPGALGFRNPSSTYVQPAIAIGPASYPVGQSFFRIVGWTINGASYDGMVTTFRSADGVVQQYVVDAWAGTQKRTAERTGMVSTNVWNDWISAPGGPVLALQNGWTALTRGATVEKVGGLVHLRGRIGAGTITNGTVITTLPVGFRPYADEYRAVLCGSTLNTAAAIGILSGGNVIVAGVSNAAALDLGCTFSIY